MKVFITGGTGFVGSSLTRELSNKGHQVTVLDRTIKAEKEFPSTVSFIEADSTVRGQWQDIAAQHEIFICTAPQPVRNSEMTKAIGEVLGVPTLPFGVPGFMMKIILGEFGNVLLKGQKVIPERLAKLEFQFKFPTIHAALKDLLNK